MFRTDSSMAVLLAGMMSVLVLVAGRGTAILEEGALSTYSQVYDTVGLMFLEKGFR